MKNQVYSKWLSKLSQFWDYVCGFLGKQPSDVGEIINYAAVSKDKLEKAKGDVKDILQDKVDRISETSDGIVAGVSKDSYSEVVDKIGQVFKKAEQGEGDGD